MQPYRSRRTNTEANLRDRSPLPLKSPSPDYMTRSIIVNTKTPEIRDALDKIQTPRNRIPLNEEVMDLRRENQLLRNQIQKLKRDAPTYKSMGVFENPEKISLLNALDQKNQEIANLKAQLKQPRLNSSRKITLSKSLIPSQKPIDKQMQNKIQDLIDQNQNLKKQLSKSRIVTNVPRQVYQNLNNLQKQILQQTQRTQNEMDRHLQSLEIRLQVAQQKQNKLTQTMLKHQSHLSPANKPFDSINRISTKRTNDGSSPMPRGDSGKLHRFDEVQDVGEFETGYNTQPVRSLESTKRPAEDNTKRLQEQLIAAKSTEQQLIRQLNMKNKEIELLNIQINQLRNEAKRGLILSNEKMQEAEIQALKKVMAEQAIQLENQKNSKNQEIAFLKKQLQNQKEKKNQPMYQSSVRNQINQLRNQNNGQRQHIDALKKLVNEKDNQIFRLQNIETELNAVKRSHQTLWRDNEALKKQIDLLRRSKSQYPLNRNVDNGSEKISELERMLNSKKNELNLLEEHCKYLEDTVEKKQSQIEKLKMDLYKLELSQDQLIKYRDRLEEFMGQNDRLKRELEAQKANHTNSNEFDQLRSQYQRLFNQNQNTSNTLRKQTRQLEQALDEIRRLKALLTEIDVEGLQHAFNDRHFKNHQNTDNIQKLRRELANSLKEKIELKEQLANTQNSIRRYEDEKKALLSKIQDLSRLIQEYVNSNVAQDSNQKLIDKAQELEQRQEIEQLKLNIKLAVQKIDLLNSKVSNLVGTEYS